MNGGNAIIDQNELRLSWNKIMGWDCMGCVFIRNNLIMETCILECTWSSNTPYILSYIITKQYYVTFVCYN